MSKRQIELFSLMGMQVAVDQRGEMGQFILTGSTMPLRSETMHSGTGRISRLKMRTMSLFESGESTGQVSLERLFNQDEPEGTAQLSIERLAFTIARGGWPASIGLPDKAALTQAGKYLISIVENDVFELSDVQRNPRRIMLLMRSLARNVATMASVETLRKDVSGSESELAVITINTYLDILERLYVVENQPAWSTRLRSKNTAPSVSSGPVVLFCHGQHHQPTNSSRTFSRKIWMLLNRLSQNNLQTACQNVVSSAEPVILEMVIMLNQETMNKLKHMKLTGMVDALQQQQDNEPGYTKCA